jgi:hypothetical protein
VLSLLQAAHSRPVDAVTAEVVLALRAADVRAIVLKGPVFARWLYRDGAIRSYVDSDILVAPEAFERACDVLASLGFAPLGEATYLGAKHAHCWARGGAEVDLHQSIAGAHADDAVVWAALARDTETMRLADADVEIPGPAANGLIAALHAAAHGSGDARSAEDLSRALADERVWSGAARLAAEVDAEAWFAAGLRTLPAGREVADRLGLDRAASVDVLLRADGAPKGAVFLGSLATTAGWRARLRLLVRAIVPEPDYMRDWYPRARRGRIGLVAAYISRVVVRLATLGPALRALAAARRQARA